MADLKEFLAELAIDPQKLGEFIHDPESAMEAAGLTDNDKAALRSGFASIIYARLAGLPTEQAFQVNLRAPVGPPQIVMPVIQQVLPQLPLQGVFPPQLPVIQQLPPVIQQLPPQLPVIQQLPPTIHQLPPQLPVIHQLPPIYQLPPQLPVIHQLPPIYQLPPQLPVIHQLPPV